MNKKLDYIVYIGRFQPCHLAHIEVMKQALTQADNLIVLVGSAMQPRTIRNPFLWQERSEMILNSLPTHIRDRTIPLPLRDIKYNDQKWVKQVQDLVIGVAGSDSTIGIIGHSKDETSYYLKMFPQWELTDVENIKDIHASEIRDDFFSIDIEKFDIGIGRYLPTAIHSYMKAFALRSEYEQLVREYDFIQTYKQAWAGAPHPPIFVTVDAVVVQAGHVLLVRRRAEPGRGLFALPGGFVNKQEKLRDAAIRELREETKIKVPDPVLRGSITKEFVADEPNRSLRGRTISHVFAIELNAGDLPKVKGSDDADKALWVPLSTFERMEDQMFEDHYHLVQKLAYN